VISKVSGARNCASSRSADAISTLTGAPLGICTPLNSMSVEAKQNDDISTGLSKRRNSSMAVSPRAGFCRITFPAVPGAAVRLD
jgi:hypothetical protein